MLFMFEPSHATMCMLVDWRHMPGPQNLFCWLYCLLPIQVNEFILSWDHSLKCWWVWLLNVLELWNSTYLNDVSFRYFDTTKMTFCYGHAEFLINYSRTIYGHYSYATISISSSSGGLLVSIATDKLDYFSY